MIFLIIIIVFITLCYVFVKNRYSYWKNLGFLQFDPIFPYGNIKDVNSKIHNTDFSISIYEKFKSKSPLLVGIYSFIQPIAIITDLNLIKSIMIKDFNNFTDRPVYYNEKDDPLSAHLFSLDGDRWRPLRSKLTSTFTSGKMKFMFPTVVKVAKELKQAFDREIISNNIDLYEILAKFTTDVIGTCAFGIECNSLRNPNALFRKYGKKIFNEPRQSALGRALKSTFMDLSRFLRIKNVDDEVANFFMTCVKETVAYREENNIKRNDFMDLLIELKNKDDSINKLTIEQIAAQAFVFFIAGFETSSTNMTFTLYELAKNQEIQNTLRNEIVTTLNKYNGELTYEAMIEMKYLDLVITESLRMYPPLVNLPRKAINDYQIQNTNLIIPARTTVLIPAYAIHHDPNIYPNPEIYNPENFSFENVQNRHSTTFLGFGDGPRNCIGLRFGKMQTKIGLITLLTNFRFDITTNTPRKIKFAMNRAIVAPEGNLHLKIEKI